MATTGKFLSAFILLASLAACAGSPGGSSDDAYGRIFFAPGKYAMYKCDDLADRATANLTRQREFEGLIAKAGTGSGGQLVSGLAYRTEYLELRGEMVELRRVADEKQCKFVPGAKVSDSVVR